MTVTSDIVAACERCGGSFPHREGNKMVCKPCKWRYAAQRSKEWHRTVRPLVQKRVSVEREASCKQCRKDFEYIQYPSLPPRQFCSSRCVAAFRRGDVPTRDRNGQEPRNWDDEAVLTLMAAIFGKEQMRDTIISLMATE